MPVVFSNQLKAVLALDNILEEGVSIWQNNCFTVQQFQYCCQRQRDDAGVPYGSTQTSFLTFTLRVAKGDSAKGLLERLGSWETAPFSFLFNASFGSNKRLADYEDALVATGYLVDVEEAYDNTRQAGQEQEQMLISGKLLLTNLAYLGLHNTLKLIIVND